MGVREQPQGDRPVVLSLPFPRVHAPCGAAPVIPGVHFPALSSLLAQKVRESERALAYSTVGSGTQCGYVPPFRAGPHVVRPCLPFCGRLQQML